ncbi:MAG: hypothetical protein F6J90_19825 [Moorea sp. SIOASIH]|uniref:hypothetical protein n=1 Tax=Moorena sp. SIOASIH TaxID=2607817 RepID=UPI0013B98F86|nr:hypothetical protein [Moorena sp. SIOASIH]NEO38459.1 hypothetical protein [Moorena sp. SIOASIH]
MTLTLTFSHAKGTVTLRERSRYGNEIRPPRPAVALRERYVFTLAILYKTVKG